MKQAQKRWVPTALAVVLIVIAGVLVAVWTFRGRDTSAFLEKTEPLRQAAMADWLVPELGQSPAGQAGFAVFFSVCDGERRAQVYSGAGETLEDAWDNALDTAEHALRKIGLQPRWVKSDVVFYSQTITAEKLRQALQNAQKNFFRYGISFTPDFSNALLEAELNSAGIYDYESGTLDLETLNTYLKSAGRPALKSLPQDYTVFQTFGWLCDEAGEIWELTAAKKGCGRRRTAGPEPEEMERMVRSAAEYLTAQIGADGAFTYGVYPGRDQELSGYNMLRHAGAVWALARCPAEGTDASDTLDRAVQYLVDRVVYRDAETAYLLEEKNGEIKLGGCGLSIIALTEYMDRAQSEEYTEVCCALGRGIISMMDPATGAYQHVLNADFTLKDAQRSIYYDGEATFALCRLYGLTGEEVFLEAARRAVDHFIAAGYVQYKDHWVSYAMNDFTKYVSDEPVYYTFALENVQRNLAAIQAREVTAPTDLELLMAAFELYDRMMNMGASVEGFDQDAFLTVLRERADRQLDGYLYPELAMYMERPQTVLGAFMVRQDDFRIRIDDVQHSIMGCGLFLENYEPLMSRGMARRK